MLFSSDFFNVSLQTLETISLLGYLFQFRDISGPHLIIVPKSTLGNWMRELERWCPSLKTFRFHAMKEDHVCLCCFRY